MTIEVLVVDEDEEVLPVTETFLERQDDIAVATELDPTEALDRVASEGFDAVVTDLSMDALGGIDLARQLRAAGHDVPVVVFTGSDPEDVDGRDEVTAVVTKGGGNDQYETVAGHIKRALGR